MMESNRRMDDVKICCLKAHQPSRKRRLACFGSEGHPGLRQEGIGRSFISCKSLGVPSNAYDGRT